jgi:hypothetical protein
VHAMRHFSMRCVDVVFVGGVAVVTMAEPCAVFDDSFVSRFEFDFSTDPWMLLLLLVLLLKLMMMMVVSPHDSVVGTLLHRS